MRVAVCVKHVPDTAARRIDQATKRLDRAGEGALNSFDANAIEEALRIKDAQGEGEIVVVSLGPQRALDSLRKALAVVAVSDAINEPRYPSLKGIMGAKKKQQDVVSLADLGVEPSHAGEAGSRTTVIALSEPPPRGDSIKVEDDGNAAEKLVEFLAE